jgi:hypothetical protein
MLDKKLKSVEELIANPRKQLFCIVCGNIASKIAYFETQGATIIERYCNECVKKVIDKRLKTV